MKVNVYVVGADVKVLVQELYWLFTVTIFSIGPYFMPLCARACVREQWGLSLTRVFPCDSPLHG